MTSPGKYAVGLLCACLVATAQTTDELNARLKAMEARIQSLEEEVQSLKAAQSAAEAAEAAPAPAPIPAPPQPSELAQLPSTTTSGDPTASARLLNPAVSVIGNFLGAVGSNPIDQRPALQMTESEVGLSAAVDPYARADFFLSFGEEGVELEEGYITFPTLPAGFLLKAGRLRARFGKVNTLHRHVVPWVDRPLVTENLLGGEEGIRDAGFSVSRILPAPGGVFLEATGELYRGDSEGVFASEQRRDAAVVGHLRGYKDLSEETNLDLGFSFARGHNGLADSLTTKIYGLDATLRWKPLRQGLYRSFIGRAELIWSQQQQPLGLRGAFGYFVSGEYQLARRWFAGARFDQSDRMGLPDRRDSGVSALLTFWPSEFNQVRVQYRHTRYAEDRLANELLFQFQFNIGAHGAHPF